MDVKRTERPVAPASSLRRSVSSSLGGKAVEIVTLALLATVVPRALGPSDYGHFSVPLTVVTLGSLAMTLGGPTLMARYVPAAAPDRRLAIAKAIGARLARGRALQLAAIAGAAALLVAVDPETFSASDTAIVVFALALNVAATLALQIGLGLGRTGAWSFRYPLQNAVLVGAVLALHSSSGRDGAVLAIAVAAIAGAAFGAGIVVPLVRPTTPRVAVPVGAIRFGVHQATGAALTQFSQRGSVLAVAVLATSATETGYAALATGIALGVTYAVLQTFTVALTHLADGDRDGVAQSEATLRRLAGWLLATIVPAAIVGVLVLDDVVPVLFGDDYVGAVDAFGPALALVVLAPLYSLGVQTAALRLRPEVASASGAAAACAFVVVALLAVPAWDAAGGTVASLAGGAAGVTVAARLLPGAFGPRIIGASVAGVVAVLGLSLVT